MSKRQSKEPRLPKQSEMAAGARLALTNSRRHLRIARMLGKERFFGAALAHIVLSLEEQAKGWFLTFGAIGIDLPKKDLREILTRHDSRQGLSFSILFIGLIQYVGFRAASRVQKRHKKKSYPPELRDEWVSELKRDLKSLAAKSAGNDPALLILKWIVAANDLKNRGLYVDFDGRKWVAPTSVPPKQFAVGYEIAKGLLRNFGTTYRNILKANLTADDELKHYVESQLVRTPRKPEESLHQLITLAFGPAPINLSRSLKPPKDGEKIAADIEGGRQ